MGKNYLVIVESPTKAKTIRKFLPKEYQVEASMGHIRDLPQSAADIPKEVKKEEWSKIGVNVEQDFSPLYVIPKGKTKVITELKRKLKDAEGVYLATDEDREGESISWHLLEVLKPKVPVKRMVFHEITKSAIEKALKDCREIDMRLVRAQEARRILDRLFGYTLSPLLWKKIAYGLSAGRVQSSALRIIIERERARLAFVKANYWDLSALLHQQGEEFEAKLVLVDGLKVATGKDFDPNTGKLLDPKNIKAFTEKEVLDLQNKLKSVPWKVSEVEERNTQSKPYAPFITSTLQQEANRKLGLSAREAMRVAQSLYEEGFITYMRTDSPSLSQEGLSGARGAVVELYGKEYLSPEPRQFQSKSRNAQEAHEAIRPAGAEFVHPKDSGLKAKELELYELIWKRTVASQMAEAKKLSVTVKIEADGSIFQTNGSRILFPGYLRAYVEGSDDPESALEDREVILPELKKGDVVKLQKTEPHSHDTLPPARYTEASLVQTMEREGIGRPSTYASVIGTITERGYVKRMQNQLVPTFVGFAVVQLLEKHFEKLVDLKFTAKMEQSLDDIAEGNKEWLPYLKEFYLGKDGLQEQIKSREKQIDPNESRRVDLNHLKDIEVRIGRYGPYLVKAGAKDEENVHASIPEDLSPADLTPENTNDYLEASARGPQSLGKHPETGENVYCLVGRYGPYVQMGEVTEAVPKPKRAPVIKGMDPKTLTLDQAVQLLMLPRTLGDHPTSGKPIKASIGRFGPYIVHDNDFRSLKKEDNLFTVTLDRALEILAQEKKSKRGSTLIREIGTHPEKNKVIGLYEGKFGPYLKMGTMNASIPKETKPEDVTLAQAVELFAQRKEYKKSKRKAG